MNRVVVDPVTVEKLRNTRDVLILCDSADNILGRFTPAFMGADGMGTQISEEELTRRENEGGGRRLAEILADLEAGA